MRRRTIPLRYLSEQGFAPFGIIADTLKLEPEVINDGNTLKFDDLFPVDCTHQGGRPAVHLYRSKPCELPLEIHSMERHPLGSQAFWPLSNRAYIVVVAPPAPELDESAIRAFLAYGHQAIQYHRGTWHHYQISLEVESDYLVLDREGPGNNCDEVRLTQPISISLQERLSPHIDPG